MTITTNKHSLVIIGSGLAGYMVAKEFRKLNAHHPLTILTANNGSFYSKPLLSTALTQNKTAEALTLFSAQAMQEQLNAEIQTQVSVSAIDIQEKTVTYMGNKICYSALVIACGAQTIKPILTGDAVNDIVSINELEHYTYFRQWLVGKKRIAILGAGLVGCEFANDLSNVGYEVLVIAPENYPLARLIPESIGHCLQAQIQQKGMQWLLNELAISVDRVVNGYQITLRSGKKITVDGIVSAVGLKPAVEFAKTAPLILNRGIVVDPFLKTNVSQIYALGDCAEKDGEIKPYVAPILQGAKALATTLSGEETAVNYPCIPIVVKTPACPLVIVPPKQNIEGEWRTLGEANNLIAAYYDADDVLQGFVLSGEATKQRMEWVKRLESATLNT